MNNNQPMRQKIIHDASQTIEINESVPWMLSVNNEREGTISSRVKLQETSSIDFICDSIAVIALIDNPDNPGQGDVIPTTQYKINIRDTMSQQSWIFTAGGSLSQYSPIPVSLIAGIKPTPLPTPRVIYQNTQLEITVEPESGKELCYFSFTFYGRRIDSLAPWERQQVCGDPRTSGAHWIYMGPLNLERSDTVSSPCSRGAEAYNMTRIPTLPFDTIVTSISGIVTDPRNSCIPIGRSVVEFKLRDDNNKNVLGQNFVPTSMLGGSNMYGHDLAPMTGLPCEYEQVALCCPRSMPLYGAWRIRGQTSVSLIGRTVYSPVLSTTSDSLNLHLLLHGMRVPTDEIAAGYPYYNRNDGSQRCPPGSPGIPPGIPQGPQGPYVGYPPPNQIPPQQNLGNYYR